MAFSHKAGEPQNTVTGGAIRQAAGGFRTQAAIVPGADHNARPFDHAEADVLGVVAATKLLCAADEQEPIGWAGAMWGM